MVTVTEKEAKKFVGCHVSQSFFKHIEDYCRNNGYGSKSEFLRTAMRNLVGHKP